jgi:hypothetical protein
MRSVRPATPHAGFPLHRPLSWPLAGYGWAVAVLAVAVALHAAGLIALLHGELNFLFNDAGNRLGRGADFFALYGAGDHFLGGVSVYQPQADGDAVPYAYAFRYLPSAGFTLGAVTNLLPPWDAYWTWVGVNEVLVGVNVLLTWRLGPSPAWKAAGAAMWLLFTPYYLELYMGQFSFLMASLIYWLGLSLYFRQRDGVLTSWTTSLLVKTNSALLLPVMWRGGWTKAALAGIAFVALINLPYFLAVQGSWQAWSGNFDFATSDSGAAAHAGNLGLASLLTLMSAEHGSGMAAARFIGGLPVGLAVVAISLAVTLLARSRQTPVLIALWLCAYFLVFDEVWEHHYVMLLPALVLLVLCEPRLRPLSLAVFVGLALPTPYALFQAGPSPPVDFEVVDPQTFWSGAEVYVYHLSKVLPVLVLWTALCVQLVRIEGLRGVLDTARGRRLAHG